MNQNLLKNLKRAGVFGGFAKIHQLFEDRREGQKEQTADTEKPIELKDIAILGVMAVAAVAAFVLIPDDPSTKR